MVEGKIGKLKKTATGQLCPNVSEQMGEMTEAPGSANRKQVVSQTGSWSPGHRTVGETKSGRSNGQKYLLYVNYDTIKWFSPDISSPPAVP